jgi:hypothetical protein
MLVVPYYGGTSIARRRGCCDGPMPDEVEIRLERPGLPISVAPASSSSWTWPATWRSAAFGAPPELRDLVAPERGDAAVDGEATPVGDPRHRGALTVVEPTISVALRGEAHHDRRNYGDAAETTPVGIPPVGIPPHDPGVSHALRQPHFATSKLIGVGDLAYCARLLDSNLPYITSICAIAVRSDKQ